MNKTFAVVLGIITGLVSALYLNELIKAAAVLLLLKQNVALTIHGIKLSINLPFDSSWNILGYVTFMILPYLACVMFIEASFLWLKRSHSEHVKSSIIIFQLINIGYLIFEISFGIVIMLLQSSISNDWTLMLNQLELTYYQKLIFMLGASLLLLGYINILTKKIRKYIPHTPMNWQRSGKH